MRSPRLKRAIDVVGACVGLVVLCLPMALVALAVLADVGRPVLFAQARPGLHGRPFRLYKFRTMRDAVDAAGRPLPDAQRLTRLGRLLRATSLDELPELVNVLRGDMSLVGPRPLLDAYLDRYTPEQARRHEVRPGLTGLAQVTGRNACPWERRFELDVAYVDGWTLGLDVRILARTVVGVLRRDGVSEPGHATAEEFRGTPRAAARVEERPMRVVVTGGAGFIGANLVRRLLAERVAARVTVVDDLSTGSAANLDGLDGCDLVAGSVLDATLLDGVFAGAGAVVHLAARTSVPRSLEDPQATHDVNATGTLRVLEAARRAGRPHTIVASSSSVYGGNPTLPKHEGLAPAPLSPYAASKLAAEAYTLAHASSFGLPVLALRLFNVFGPLQPAGHAYAAVIPAFVSAALSGRPLTVHGDGRQTRDLTYVGSVTAVLADAVRRRVSHDGPVNLAFGTRRSLLDVIALLETILDRSLDVTHVDPRPGDVRHSQADQTRLRALFGDVEPVAFADGLRATVAWLRDSDTPASLDPAGGMNDVVA